MLLASKKNNILEVQNLDIFERGLAWKVFSEVEKEFVSFLEIIPFVPKHEKVYSFKLLNLILSIGSHVDNIFKAMGAYPKFRNKPSIKKMLKKPEITTYGTAFESIYHLSSKRVSVKSEPIPSVRTYYAEWIPFAGFQKKSPSWWKAYNDLKHTWFQGEMIQKANVKNTLRALAGLFLLIVRHESSWNRLVDYGVCLGGNFGEARLYDVKSEIKSAFDRQKEFGPLSWEARNMVASFRELWAESRLFIYRYPFWQRWLTSKKAIKNMKKWIYRQFYAPTKF